MTRGQNRINHLFLLKTLFLKLAVTSITLMMFVDAVRRHIERLPEDSSGWLAGLRDRHEVHALALIHENPSRAWTIDALANEIALSRSAFHDGFMCFIGQPPMQYLTQWRMQVAANLLRQSRAPAVQGECCRCTLC